MAKATATATVTVSMSLEKETPGTYRYADATEDSVMPTLYIRKGAFPQGAPQSITVSVTA